MKRLDLNEDWTNAWRVAHVLEEAGGAGEGVQATPPEKVEDYVLYDVECPFCETTQTVRPDASGLRSVCQRCGLVVENYTDDKPEWTTAGQDKSGAMNDVDPVRGEAINPLMPHASMTTDIVATSRLNYDQYKMLKLNRWGAQSPMERSLGPVFQKIDRACARQHPRVPSNVQYTTKTLFRRVYEINLKKHQSGNKREGLRGTKRDGLIAACLYMSFKINNLYWKKNVVAAVFDIDASEIRRGISIFWELVKECDLTESLAKVTGVKQYIRWFYAELQLPRCFATFATKLYKDLSRFGVGSSKQPQSIAAWCLWVVCSALRPASGTSAGSITLDDLAAITVVSRATVMDVDRLTQAVQRPALMEIFADDFCSTLHVRNELTRLKIVCVARALCRTSLVDVFPLWPLAAFAVYFVFTINDIAGDFQPQLMKAAGMSPSLLLNMCRTCVPYREALISECVGEGGRRRSEHHPDDDDEVVI